jgi:hypothetical protein
MRALHAEPPRAKAPSRQAQTAAAHGTWAAGVLRARRPYLGLAVHGGAGGQRGREGVRPRARGHRHQRSASVRAAVAADGKATGNQLLVGAAHTA